MTTTARGANDCSGTPTVFDDAAATAISAGTAPFAGTFRPESPLSAFNGKAVTGTWKLRATDTAALDTGTVGCVQLQITRQRFVCCGVAGTPQIAVGRRGGDHGRELMSRPTTRPIRAKRLPQLSR